MKYFFIFAFSVLILFSLFFPQNLFSQDFREARIFIPPVSGIGTLDERTYFYKQLTYEAVTQYHSIIRMKAGSDYILKGRIEPFACLHDPFIACPLHPRWEQDGDSGEILEYIFYLELINSKTDEIIGGQYIIYKEINTTIDGMLSVLVYNMLSGIPDISLGEDRRNRWLFLDASLLWAPRIYKAETESVYWLNFGVGASAEVQFLNFMSASVGLQFTQDWIYVSEAKNEEFRDLIIDIPISIRFVFKPGDYFLLSPYGGMSYNFSVIKSTEPSAYSWFVGFQFGVKAGPGFVTIDPRFTMDYYKSNLSPVTNDVLEYQRYMVQIGLGYKFGFIQKKKKKDY